MSTVHVGGKTVPIKFLVSEEWWSRIARIMIAEEINQSEYMRSLIRDDLKRREARLVSALTETDESPE